MYTATLTIDNVLPVTTVSLPAELTVRELIEAVFVQLQTSGQPDPFLLTIDYYGYDYFQGDTSYLGTSSSASARRAGRRIPAAQTAIGNSW